MFWNGWHLPFKDLDLWWLLSPRPSINSSIVTVAGQQREVVYHCLPPSWLFALKGPDMKGACANQVFFREIPGKLDISKNCCTPNLYWWIRAATLQPARSLHSLWFYGKSSWNFGEVVGSSGATPSWVKKSLSLDKIGFVVIENLDHDCSPTCQEYCAWDNKIWKRELFHIISDGLMDGWKKHILVLYLNGM